MNWIIFVVCLFEFLEYVDGMKRFGNPDEWADDILKPPSSRSLFAGDIYLWTNNTIPYVIDPNFDSHNVVQLQASLDHYHIITDGCISFIPRTAEEDYVLFVDTGDICASYVGMIPGEQLVTLPDYCFDIIGTVFHELLHLLGFKHEHVRTDRNRFITLHWDNIDPAREEGFEMQLGVRETDYDYESIMHYSAFAGSKNGLMTIETTDPAFQGVIGQRTHLSPLDLQDGIKRFGNPDEWADDILKPPSSRSLFAGEIYLWTNNTIPYVIDPNFDSHNVVQLQASLDHYHIITDGCISFIPRTTEEDYVKFVDTGDKCASFVGMIVGEQLVTLPDYCFDIIGTVFHELLHLLGFKHEHVRTDRNRFITIHWDNIDPAREESFEMQLGVRETDYDYESIMHYSAFAGTLNGLMTIETTDPAYQDVIGQRTHVSPLDLQGLRTAYNCL